jgi:hypothetical protein
VPDRTLKTISATEAPALFNASPYVTRWMLWQRFANGMDIDSRADARMNWGRKLQPLILEQVAEEMRLEVRPNNEDAYMRRGLLGCTRDATIICPDRGPGAVETKCVFDYRTWMADWNGGKQPPRHHEIQLQQQMIVGDEGGESYRWGLLVAWIAGELHYFERAPVKDLWAPLYQEAERFFADVQAKREPEPFGAPVELPLLAQLFPTIKGNTIDLTAHPEGEAFAIAAREYRAAKEQESAGSATAEPLRAKVLAFAKDADEVLLPGAISVRVRPHGKGKRITVWWPEDGLSRATIPDDLLMAG